MSRATSGFDGAKKVPGRKRHTVVDTLGLLLAVAITAANAVDHRIGHTLLDRAIERPRP
ncbi:transposase [Streptomyces sp. NRRL F-5053]|uniref:transposase n=1 Tax=Streptomyces sp. NRRL F-5053 TaxID=1463854 RepID=UPI001F3C94F1|nr:transposase [Streptomyces sp. NRRL F-5053]